MSDEELMLSIDLFPQAVLVLDGAGLISAANAHGRDVLECVGIQVGQSALALVGLKERDQVESWGRGEGEVLTQVDTALRRIHLHISQKPSVLGIVWFLRDATDEVEREEALRLAAWTDSLTGLGNRHAVDVAIQEALQLQREGVASCAVLKVDLDRFAAVNDALGHAAGDELMRQMAGRLRSAVRDVDVLGRMGADEFVVVVRDAWPPESAQLLAERLLEVVSGEVHLEGRSVSMRASVGLAFARGQESSEDLLSFADVALKEAKRRGSGQWRVHVPGERRGVGLDLSSDLRRSIESGRVGVAWQLIGSPERTVVGAESLVRWEGATKWGMGPQEVVAALEEIGLGQSLTLVMLEQGCAAALRWREHLRVNVNMTAADAMDPLFPRQVEDVLTKTGLDPRRLTLEVTEGALLADLDTACSVLSELRSLGAKVVLDDFGTGYSSMSWLHRLPVDGLKVDKSFLRGAEGGKEKAILSGIIQLGKALSLTVVVEGVESEEEALLVKDMGADLIQGYWLARPLDSQDMEQRYGGSGKRP